MTRPSSLVLESRHTGERLELTRLADADGPWLEVRGSLPPGQDGPPLHVHFLEDELGRVTAGRLGVQVGDRTFELGPGEAADLPRGVPHRWWNAGDDLLEFEGAARPVVDLDRYLQAVFEIVNASPDGRPSMFYMAHVALRHRRSHRVVEMPFFVRAVVLPVAVAVGHLFGKYRGEDWPGCPARCTGAPEGRAAASDV